MAVAPKKPVKKPVGKVKLDKITDSEDYLKRKSRKIRKLIKKGDNEYASEIILKSLTSLLVDLLPIAEAKYRKDPRQGSAYALNNLIATTRELAADLQASSDKSVVVNNIVFNILQPSAQTITTFLIDNNFTLKKEMEKYIIDGKQKDVNDIIDKMSRSHVQYMKAILENIQNRVTETLLQK